MPRYKDGPPAIRVYTVCDESRYLIVRNVPSLGCQEELHKLFAGYGPVEDCKPMHAEESEPFTDVYWIKFQHVNNARFAKRKLDDFVFFGNQLQVSYAPEFEDLSDTKDKLECRRRDVITRIRAGGPASSQNSVSHGLDFSHQLLQGQTSSSLCMTSSKQQLQIAQASHVKAAVLSHVSSNEDYFPNASMNRTVQIVRDKLDKIASSAESSEVGAPRKKARVDNRRRI